LNLALTSRQGVRTQWIQSAIASPGPGDARIEAMFQAAMTIRDALDCRNGAPANELAVCLPNSLRNADSAVDEGLAAAADKVHRHAEFQAPSAHRDDPLRHDAAADCNS
jgi:hypothetical protein